MELSPVGRIVSRYWSAIPQHCPDVALDAFVVMPNHIHGILAIAGDPDASTVSTDRISIPTIVGGFKSAVTREVRRMDGFAATRVWQSRYYEHVLRSESALRAIRQYIVDNPLKWHLDLENPKRTG